jgi:hypothetical protein
MMNEPVMRVGATVHSEKLGQLIVVGLEQTSSLSDIKVPNLVDKYIIIETATGSLRFKVKKMDLSTSIWGAMSIGIILYDSDDFIKIQAGDEVFAVVD